MQNAIFVAQLEAVSAEFGAMRSRSQYNDISDLPKNERQALVSRAIAAVRRATGPDSAYSKDIDRLVNEQPELHIDIERGRGIRRGHDANWQS